MEKAFSGMYVHIPFCISKCRYCSFCSFPVRAFGDDKARQYIDAVIFEMEQSVSDWSEERFDSLYVGGGTPSVLPSLQIVRLIQKAFELYRLEKNSEATVECNPGSLTPQKAFDFFEAGFNRISFGVQSANDAELKMLGRPHTFADAQNAIDYARAAGFTNINADLMYGLPGQKPEDFYRNVRKTLDLGVEHLSCYALTLEEGTALYEDVCEGRLPKPDEDAAAEMFEGLGALTAEYGLNRYEISNYAKPRCESRHNLHYWRHNNYAGFGLAAHSAKRSSDAMMRMANPEDLDAYLAEKAAKLVEKISGPDFMFEYVMLGTRLTTGLNFEDFFERFGVRFDDAYKDAIDKAVSLGLARMMQTHFYLTDKGMLLQNSVLQWFMP